MQLFLCCLFNTFHRAQIKSSLWLLLLAVVISSQSAILVNFHSLLHSVSHSHLISSLCLPGLIAAPCHYEASILLLAHSLPGCSSFWCTTVHHSPSVWPSGRDLPASSLSPNYKFSLCACWFLSAWHSPTQISQCEFPSESCLVMPLSFCGGVRFRSSGLETKLYCCLSNWQICNKGRYQIYL